MNVLKSLNQRGQHNWIKIVCLAVGLATGIVLIGKAGFEQSWDKFFPTSDRIYVVCEDIIMDGEYKHYPQTAGAVAHGIKRYCPQVEAATRYTSFAWDMPIVTDDDKRVRTNYALVDSCFFDVFPFRILVGNPKKTLSQVDCCMIPRSLAEKLMGIENPLDLVGKKIYYNIRGGWALTVGGIYEDIPLNSKLHGMEVMVSMPTITRIMFDGRDNWVGNDRYESYVRLAKGIMPDDLKPQIEKMKRDNLPLDELKKAGVDLGFSVQPLVDYHTKDEGTRRMTWIVSILAAVLIGCAVMNYLLLVIGGISQRAKEMAVHQCYGAKARHIYQKVMTESIVHLLLSLTLAALLLFLFKDTIEELVGAPLIVLLLTGCNLWLIVSTCLVVLLITGLVPSWIYTHIPLAAAFKNYNHSHRIWKLLLLGLQFASATFLIILLIVVGRQYRMMVNDDPGYDYSTLGSLLVDGVSIEQRQLAMDELRKLSSVKGVTMSYANLTQHQSGDNILLPGDDREYMNIADLYYVGDGYFDVMEIPLVSGRTFTEQTDTLREVMVSRKFEERMKELAGWDQALGKQIICTSFQGPYTIVGVFEDTRIGSITNPDTRPSVCYYSRKPEQMHYILIRFQSMDGLEAANKLVKELVTDNPDISIVPYNQMVTELYTDAHRFRTTVMIGGLVALIIALIGLIGYLAGEIARRQKEIAIRKVNGARIADVLKLFHTDILRVALPAVMIGAIGAWYVARLWLEQFSEKTTLSPIILVGGALAVIIVILSVVCLGCYRVASSNPVNYLKTE
ncbi:ABC transporter permease [Prevotella sp. E2-28]|uniref:ABC transporter permease n=1 Tax=Prevotella sp. E2-28 TaxID=2913620 RepID=UPI001EDAA352|nr:ABC transporter permease [Prevotella sp. E2-28]UKK53917.1 ABC transporter permease [Prevotella sp. E2-28]